MGLVRSQEDAILNQTLAIYGRQEPLDTVETRRRAITHLEDLTVQHDPEFVHKYMAENLVRVSTRVPDSDTTNLKTNTNGATTRALLTFCQRQERAENTNGADARDVECQQPKGSGCANE